MSEVKSQVIAAKLAEIQQNLRAPKSQVNTFGKYNYRSCEDILEAVKPLLDGAVLTISDEPVMVGSWIFIKATASLMFADETISVSAVARHADEKKGMDASQVSGATSSYARKYALNGLFCIDDEKDADTQDNRPQQTNGQALRQPQRPPVNKPQPSQDKFSDRLNAEFNLDPDKVLLKFKEMKPDAQAVSSVNDLPGQTKAWISANLGKFQDCGFAQ